MEDLPRDDAFSGAFAHAVRRHRPSILATALILAIVGIAYSLVRAHSYTSSTTLQIRPLVGNAFSPDVAASDQNAAVALQTEANLVDSLGVTRLVNENTNSSLNPASSKVTGTVPLNTTLVTITYTSQSASNAKRYATAYANAFLAYRSAQATAVKQAQVDALAAQVSSTTKSLAEATTAAEGPNPPPGATTEQNRYASKLASLQSQLSAAYATDTDPGTIVVPASTPHGGTSVLTIVAFGLVGALVGFFLGAAIAYRRYRRDDHISAEETYGSVGGLPLLAVLPNAYASEYPPSPEGADSDLEDALRRARVGVLASAEPSTVLAICPVSRDETVTGITVDLARSLTAAQYRVIVLDASLAEVSVAQRLGLPEPRTGLSEALSAEAVDPQSLIVSARGLSILPGGRDPQRARDRFSSPAFARLLDEMSAEADFVLVAARSPLTGDGSSVLRVARSTILVATDGRTTHADLDTAAETSERLAAPVLGVLLRIPPRRQKWPLDTAGGKDSRDASAGKGDGQPQPTRPAESARSGGGATARRGDRSAAGRPADAEPSESAPSFARGDREFAARKTTRAEGDS